MRHILFGENADNLTTAILIKDTGLVKAPIARSYVEPLAVVGIPRHSIIAFDLPYGKNKKIKVDLQKEYLNDLLPEIVKLGITILYCTDGEFFKTLTKSKKAEPHLGYILPCAIEGYEHLNVILGVHYQALVYNPGLQEKLDISLQTLAQYLQGSYQEPGIDIIHYAEYPDTVDKIRAALQKLQEHSVLVCDIEAVGLRFYSCGLATISFAWSKHEGTAFAVDRHENPKAIRELLKEFFTQYCGTIVYHNGGHDMKVLVFQLWMSHLPDYTGMWKGIDALTESFDDTKLIAYLATNNCVKNSLRLKDLAQEFAGNYAQDSEDIKDTRRIPLPELLKYNLVDCLSTWFVYEKYWPLMVEDNQLDIYRAMFKPSAKVILQMELTGMPIDMDAVFAAREELEKIVSEHKAYLDASPIVQEFHYQQLEARVAHDNTKLKKKVRTIEEYKEVKFNPGSDQQLQRLIYDFLGYEVIDTTDSGAPATGSKTLEKLVNHAKSEEHKEIFQHLIGLAKADKVLTSFIPAFIENSMPLGNGSWRLYGSFNLGGTQSGRLSSSDPNLQNIPSGSVYAKLIKKCFISGFGWLFCGADFNALEAVCEALLSRDPNKLRVYLDGFDSHSINAFAYFSKEMPDIKEALPNERTFKIVQDGVVYYLKEDEKIISPDGKEITIKDYYESTN